MKVPAAPASAMEVMNQLDSASRPRFAASAARERRIPRAAIRQAGSISERRRSCQLTGRAAVAATAGPHHGADFVPDDPRVQDDEPVHPRGGLRAVRHQDRGASLRQLLDALRHQRSARRVQVRGGLVQQDHGRRAQEQPRQGDALGLARGHALPDFPDRRLQRDLVRPCPATARAMSSSEAPLRPSRMLSRTVPWKSVGRCGSHATRCLHSRMSRDSRGTPIDLDRALLGACEPVQEGEEGGLARAAVPGQRHALPGGDMEIQRRRTPVAAVGKDTPRKATAGRAEAMAGAPLPRPDPAEGRPAARRVRLRGTPGSAPRRSPPPSASGTACRASEG